MFFASLAQCTDESHFGWHFRNRNQKRSTQFALFTSLVFLHSTTLLGGGWTVWAILLLAGVTSTVRPIYCTFINST